MEQARPVVTVDPAVRFGRPTMAGISTDIIADMVAAGNHTDTVAHEYDLTRHHIIVACWYEAIHGSRRQWREWAEQIHPVLAGFEPLDVDTLPDPPRTPSHRSGPGRGRPAAD